MIRVAAFLLMAASAFGAVEGVVRNETTGAAQAGAMVTVYRLGGTGMDPVQTVKTDANGAFSIDHDTAGAPHLLQTIYEGAIYNQMLSPGAPTTGLTLAVYDSTSSPDDVSVTQHMILIEPMGGILHINESIIVRNSGNRTYTDSTNGTMRVLLPADKRGEPRVMVTAPRGMPVERSASATDEDNVYMIDFPVKPGETRFDLTYVVPEPESKVFAGKVLHGGGPIRLVTPEGVSLEAGNISELGHEPSTHATIYNLEGTEYAVKISGTGALRAPEESAQGSGEGPGVQQIPARINSRAAVFIGLGSLILALGFLLLFRRGEGTNG